MAGVGRGHSGQVGTSDTPEPTGKDVVRTLNRVLQFARRLPFDYFSEIRLARSLRGRRDPEWLLSLQQVYFSLGSNIELAVVWTIVAIDLQAFHDDLADLFLALHPSVEQITRSVR
jgi:hypothetical protein